jgi:hypothetical protein
VTDDSFLESPISAYEWDRNHKAPVKASTVKESIDVVTVSSALPRPVRALKRPHFTPVETVRVRVSSLGPVELRPLTQHQRVYDDSQRDSGLA